MPKRPHADQKGTEDAAGIGNIVEAAREIHEGMGWSLERYAALWVALQRTPGQATALWAAQGIHHPKAGIEIERQWSKRIENDPEMKARWAAWLAQHGGG